MKDLRPIAAGLLIIGLLAGSPASAATDKETDNLSDLAGKYQGTAIYADPAGGIAPIAMAATIQVKAKGKNLTLTITSAFPSTWGTPTTYPFTIQLVAAGRKFSGTASGAAVTPATAVGQAKLKKNKLSGTITTSLLGGVATDSWVFTIPISVKFSKKKISLTATPSDNLGFSWGSVTFSGKRK